MFGGSGRNGFAIGLIAGIALTLILLTHGEPLYDLVNGVTDGSGQNDTAGEEKTNEPNWWNWTRRLVAAEDTLAQWVMAAFSIVAVVLLWFTWRSTQQMVADTRDIGEAQTRAYLSVEGATVVPTITEGDPSIRFDFACTIRNCGQSPARVVALEIKINNRTGPKTIIQDIGAGAEVPGWPMIHMPEDQLQWLDETTYRTPVDFVVSFRDVFAKGEEKTVETVSFMASIEMVSGETSDLSPLGSHLSNIQRRLDEMKKKRSRG